MPPVPRLMLITSQARTTTPLPDLAARAIAGGVDAVQLREPGLSNDARRDLAVAIVERIESAHRLIVNDDPALAAELGCGLHLPERRELPDDLRKVLVPRALIGRSVHNPASAACSGGVDYVIAGHVFPTASKPDAAPIGLDGLAAIVAAAPVPVLAVGGITAERISAVMKTGAHGVAVIGAIATAAAPETAAADLRREIDRVTAGSTPMPGTSCENEPTVSLNVNGKPMSLPSGATIADLLRMRELDQRLVAVEHNRIIVKPMLFSATTLNDGDDVEIVQFVGGG